MLGPDGKLVGIGSLVVSDAKPNLPGNMFVPIDRLLPVMSDLLTLGRPSAPPRPWLGVNLRELDGRLVVGRVAPDGPSDNAGVRHGDRVTAIDGAPVHELADFYRALWGRGDAGVTVRLGLSRQGEEREIEVKTIDRYRYSPGPRASPGGGGPIVAARKPSASPDPFASGIFDTLLPLLTRPSG